MSPTVGFVHTLPGLVEVFDRLAETALPEAARLHVVDDDLLGTASAEPGLGLDRTATTLRRHVRGLVAQGAEAVLVTCSTLGPATEIIAATLPVPVLRIDRPMAEVAARSGRRLAVIATVESNLRASAAIVRESARALGSDVEVEAILCAAAFTALAEGRRDEHDRLVATEIARLGPGVDAVVLAQASMASAAAGITSPTVLTSPECAVRALAAVAVGDHVAPLPAASGGAAQLRIYRIRPGLMADWLSFFREVIVPLHHLVGVRVPVAYRNPADPDEFVWVREFTSVELAEKEEAQFFATPQRQALGDVRERYVASAEIRLLEPAA